MNEGTFGSSRLWKRRWRQLGRRLREGIPRRWSGPTISTFGDSLILVRGVLVLLGVAALLAGCGGGAGTTSKDHVHIDERTCGSLGLKFRLHGITCETATAILTVLNGHALHQTLTLAYGQGHRVRWTCNSKAPIAGPIRCSHGPRYFTMRQVR